MMDLNFTLDFLSDLSKHNNKAWMDDNKKRYQEAKQQVVQLVTDIIKKAESFAPELAGIDPKKTLFRINRDIRFSKNKDPYKTNFGASIVEGGRKSGNPGFYLHIMPGNSFVGGGVYQPMPEVLNKVRQEIDYNGKDLISIVEDKKFKSIYSGPHGEDRLKTAPKGYPKDHEYLEWLQLKHYVFMRKASDKEVASKGFVDQVVEDYSVLYPFNQFLTRAMD